VSGFLYVFFITVAFVALALAIYYWQQRSRKIAMRWTVVTIISLVFGLVFAARYYFHTPSLVIKRVAKKERAYVVIRNSTLEPLSPGKGPILTFVIENTGPVAVTGYFRDATCKFSDFVHERFLTYASNNDCGTFRLAPRATNTIQWPFVALILDDYKIKLLNENTASLYLFARGEYSDEAGNKRFFTYCRQYSTIFPNHLVFCNEDITFREPKEGD
jgi:hypothetical protein